MQLGLILVKYLFLIFLPLLLNCMSMYYEGKLYLDKLSYKNVPKEFVFKIAKDRELYFSRYFLNLDYSCNHSIKISKNVLEEEGKIWTYFPLLFTVEYGRGSYKDDWKIINKSNDRFSIKFIKIYSKDLNNNWSLPADYNKSLIKIGPQSECKFDVVIKVPNKSRKLKTIKVVIEYDIYYNDSTLSLKKTILYSRIKDRFYFFWADWMR